jgi:hypothetical protein
MARSFVPRGPFIGQGRKTRRDVAREKLDEALVSRALATHAEPFVFHGFRDAPGGGKVAIAVNGKHFLVHLGRDEADAMFRLASAAVRP